ncbi:MAG: response regulator [Actinobacteria bacterium]|nr:response regulator [Actinomycetota bacterium]
MAGEQQKTSGRKLLIIDDSIDLLKGLRMVLSKEGYLVETLSKPAMALDVVKNFEPCLVILDVMMPEVDGWQVLRTIRSNSGTARIPVLMLTAKGASEAKITGFTLGADDYLVKPFDISELKCRVAALLRRSVVGDGQPLPECSFPVFLGSGESLLIPSEDVYFIAGAKNYTFVHTYDKKYLSRLTLSEAVAAAPAGFMRVHRSYLVNIGRIASGKWASSSLYKIGLSDAAGTQIPVSRRLVTELKTKAGMR